MTRDKSGYIYIAKQSLHVGAKGTLAEYEKYGDDLLCVRYRYNKEKKIRIKTVELIEMISKWEQPE